MNVTIERFIGLKSNSTGKTPRHFQNLLSQIGIFVIKSHEWPLFLVLFKNFLWQSFLWFTGKVISSVQTLWTCIDPVKRACNKVFRIVHYTRCSVCKNNISPYVHVWTDIVKEEVKEDVAILTIRSDSSRGTWPRRNCGLPVVSTIDRCAYSGIKKEININFIGVQWDTASNESMVAGLHE